MKHFANPWAFLVAVSRYDLFPYGFPRYVAMLLPSFQFILGSILCAGGFRKLAFIATFCLMLVFAFAQVQALLRGLEISCGCFGSGDETLTYLTVVRTLFFAAAALLAFMTSNFQETQNAN
jgi:putative oxidoreductase